MTAALGNTCQGTPFATGVDAFVYPQFISAMRAPTIQDIYNPGTRWQDNSVNPAVIYETSGAGNWDVGGVEPATTTTYGTVILTDNSQPVATKVYADALAIAGAPVATTTVAGIGQLATDAEAIAGTPSTGLLALFVTPSNLAAVLAGGTNPGVFTDLTATGAVNFTGATGAITMTSATASNFGTTGAGVDLTLSSADGRVIVNGEQAVSDAVNISSAAGGIYINGALQVNLISSEAAGDAVKILASAGGVKVDATGAGNDINMESGGGSIFLIANESSVDAIKLDAVAGGIQIVASNAAAGEDIVIASTGSSVNISATENDAGAIYIRANGGASERVRLHADQGTGVDSVLLESDVGGITLLSGLASADAINLTSSAGGIDIDAALQINITGTQNAGDAIRILASAGGIDVDAVGAAGEDINITNTGGSLFLIASEADSQAVRIQASNAAGGIDIDAGTAGIDIATTGVLSIDSAGATNLTATGAFDLTLQSTAGSVIVSASESAADALQLLSTAGGIDILASGASAGEDIDIVATGSSVNITSTEDDVGAIYIRANGGVSERVRLHADQGTAVDSVRVESDAGGLTLLSGLASADAINVTASAGGVDIDGALQVNIASSQAAGDALRLIASAGGIDIDAVGSAGVDINMTNTGGSIFLVASESAVDAIKLDASSGGIQIVASGAAAGEDIVLTATGSSVKITATENVTDAIDITASGAASRINITAGTGSINLVSGLVVPVTTVLNAASPYTVLGTDYFISVDTSGGAVTVTLPAATALAGRTFVIRDTGGNAAIANITIGGGGTNLIGGGAVAATKVISAAYAGATVYSNGVTWNYAYVA